MKPIHINNTRTGGGKPWLHKTVSDLLLDKLILQKTTKRNFYTLIVTELLWRLLITLTPL